MIEPRILKGFRDSLPQPELRRKRSEQILQTVFESYGFAPIDTPVMEYTEVLLGKGGGETDKQVFRFSDNGGRDVALRFDLTVPLARFVSLHREELTFPFKCYHIAKVFRGEKPQKGRYREFIQCDFDIIGTDNPLADFEILSIMCSALDALSPGGYRIHLSHRGLINELLASRGIYEKTTEVLRSIDKLYKIGAENVRAELSGAGLDNSAAEALMDFIKPVSGTYDEVLDRMAVLVGGRTASVRRLEQVCSLLKAAGLDKKVILDGSITRGLDYYTGVVFETFLDEMPSIGSVCSGGRYDNLTGLYSNRPQPGVGASVGIDRLLAASEDMEQEQVTQSDIVFFPEPVDAEPQACLNLATGLRKSGIRCDFYLGNAKARDQYAYAQSKGARFAVTGAENGSFMLKDLTTRETAEIGSETAVETILKRLR